MRNSERNRCARLGGSWVHTREVLVGQPISQRLRSHRNEPATSRLFFPGRHHEAPVLLGPRMHFTAFFTRECGSLDARHFPIALGHGEAGRHVFVRGGAFDEDSADLIIHPVPLQWSALSGKLVDG